MVDRVDGEAFDPNAARYRTLRRPRGEPAGAYDTGNQLRSLRVRSLRSIAEGLDPLPTSEAGPLEPFQEWYEKQIFRRRTRIVRIRGGRKNPRAEVETKDVHLTTGLALGALGAVLAWEAAMSIAHGLAGLDPTSWTADIESWINGEPQQTSIATGSIGGILETAAISLLTPLEGGPAAAPSTPTSSIPTLPGTSTPAPFPAPVSPGFPFDPIL